MKISQERISFNALATFYFWSWEQSCNNDEKPYLHGLHCSKLLGTIESTFTPWNFSFLGFIFVFGGRGFFGFVWVFLTWKWSFKHSEILTPAGQCLSTIWSSVLIFVSIRASTVVKLFWKIISQYKNVVGAADAGLTLAAGSRAFTAEGLSQKSSGGLIIC